MSHRAPRKCIELFPSDCTSTCHAELPTAVKRPSAVEENNSMSIARYQQEDYGYEHEIVNRTEYSLSRRHTRLTLISMLEQRLQFA